nr:MAG TPA: hypothetical protein [Caudoviricetes sp.]
MRSFQASRTPWWCSSPWRGSSRSWPRARKAPRAPSGLLGRLVPRERRARPAQLEPLARWGQSAW